MGNYLINAVTGQVSVTPQKSGWGKCRATTKCSPVMAHHNPEVITQCIGTPKSFFVGWGSFPDISGVALWTEQVPLVSSCRWPTNLRLVTETFPNRFQASNFHQTSINGP